MAINFETWIGPRMAEHRRAEEARNCPAAVACGALETLRDAMMRMEPGRERDEIHDELDALVSELDADTVSRFHAAFAARDV